MLAEELPVLQYLRNRISLIRTGNLRVLLKLANLKLETLETTQNRAGDFSPELWKTLWIWEMKVTLIPLNSAGYASCITYVALRKAKKNHVFINQ